MVRVLAFAGARDVLGTSELLLPIDGVCSAEELLGRVCEQFPGLEPYRRSIRVAVNGAYARWEDEVRAGDEVALIPPVAGG
jgi:molybdopterin synthase catalytic subunit/molybdopterin synthase sulfur carrier subunit